MRKDHELKKWVHADCVRIQEAVINSYKDVTGSPQAAATPALPHGLSKVSLRDYQAEWTRYVQFAERNGCTLVPGRDIAWDMLMVWDYLKFRARTCKPETVKQVLTKLGHFGARFNFVLPTSKFDGDAAGHRNITRMKKQIAIDAREEARANGHAFQPADRCSPVGRRSISMILSAFRLTSEERFNELCRKDRHHIADSVMQHTGGMRFGHFPDRQYPLDAFAVDAVDATLRLVTDWSRYAGRRQYCIEFPAAPRFRSMWYEIFAPNGDLIDSYPAATVLHWHFRRLRRDGEEVVFAPNRPGESCSRDERQAWIREVLWLALPISETKCPFLSV